MAHVTSLASRSLLLLLAGYSGQAAQYGLEVWTAENGLPQNNFRGISQTPDGYLWIATSDGLVRFDGVRFTTFNKDNTPGISSNAFGTLIQDPDGDLWLNNASGSVTRYNRGSFHTYSAEEGIPKNGVRSMSQDANGNILLQYDESVGRWNKTAGELVDATPSSLGIHYEALAWDHAGFWGYDASRLHILLHGRVSHYALPAAIAGSSLWNVGTAEDGSVWAETHEGKQFFYPPGSTNAEFTDPAHPVQFSYRDVHGHIWTLHVGERLQRFLDFQSSSKRLSVAFTCFFEDREGNVWLGTQGNGLYRLQEQVVLTYSREQGLIDRNVYPILQDRSGDIWIGAWQTGLSRLSNGRFLNYAASNGLPGRLVTALAEDHDGNLWVGLYGGLAVFAHGRFRTPPGILLPAHSVPQVISEDRNGAIWIGTSNGLVVYRDGPSKTLTVEDGLAANDVRAILEAPSGDIWIGGYGGLTRLRGEQITRWTERDGLPSDSIRTLFLDHDEVLWIGTYDGGLARMKNGRFTRYSVETGLFNQGVFQILDDGRGNFWMSCNRGIYRVSKVELNEFADGKRSSIDSVAYGKADGMLNVECNGGLSPPGVKSRDGRLWFPTQDGVATVDSKTVTINPYPPPVIIESVLLDQRKVDLNGPVRVPPNRENLEIEYTALSFIRSGQIRFRYKMEGFDSNWIEAGSRRTAYYSHMPPGNFQFHVIACNSDGVWNYSGQQIPIHIQAPFYLTWWFTIAEVVALLTVIGTIVHLRLAQLEKRQALQKAFSQQLITSQEGERRRIAAELHDSLGQRLAVINNLALFSLRAHAKSDALDNYSRNVQDISSEALLAIAETREISYNLRPFQLDTLGLTKALENLVRVVNTASAIRVTSSMDNVDDAFPDDLRINFYRIVQESLNNAMKHSHASEADVHIIRNGDHITLTIRDNGRGFIQGKRASVGMTSGFGTTGMRERAHSLGGSFLVRSSPGEGTVTVVQIPGERSDQS